MTNRRIAVIIVHYQTPALLRDCLATLIPELDLARDEIIIVDNASAPPYKPAEAIAAFKNAVTLIESPQNLGFANANNLAFRHVLANGNADYILLLNSDTLLRPDAIATLLNFLQSHPQAAAVGPRLEHLDATPQQSAFGPITPISELLRGASIGPLTRLLKKHEVYGTLHNQPHQTHWLAGACILLRSTLLETAGHFDPCYFMYFEEVDFFRRIAQLRNPNLQIWYEPAAHVVHLVGQSSGIVRGGGDATQKRLPAYWFESRHRYFRKHFGYLGMLTADALWLIGHSLNLLRKLTTGVSHAHLAPSETRDLLHHCARNLLHPRSLT